MHKHCGVLPEQRVCYKVVAIRGYNNNQHYSILMTSGRLFQSVCKDLCLVSIDFQ